MTSAKDWILEHWTFAAHIRYIPLYISYFCFWSGHGLVFPLVPVFLQTMGISPGEIAVFGFVGQLCAFCSRLLVAVLADRTRLHKLITAICIVLADSFFVALLFMPKRITEQYSASRQSNISVGIGNVTQSPTPQYKPPLFEWHSDSSLWTAFVLRTLAYMILNPVSSLMDALSFSVIANVQGPNSHLQTPNAVVSTNSAADPSAKHNEQNGHQLQELTTNQMGQRSDTSPATNKPSGQNEISTVETEQQKKIAAEEAVEKSATAQRQRVRAYGLARSWGSIGYIVTSGGAAFITKVLVPTAPFTHTFICSVAVGLVLWLIIAVCIFFYRTERIASSPNLLRDIGKFAREARVLKILALLFVEAILYGMIWGNLFLFFKQIGGTSSTYYTSLLTFTLSELIVVSCFSHVLIARLGFGGAQLLVLGAYVVRYVGYALIPAIWWNVPFDLLQGITFGLQGVCMAGQMAAIAAPAMQPSAQGLAQGVFYGLGLGTGYLLGGIGFQMLGPRLLFWCGASLSAISLATFGGLHFWDVVHQRRK